jgi:hypothetical protein
VLFRWPHLRALSQSVCEEFAIDQCGGSIRNKQSKNVLLIDATVYILIDATVYIKDRLMLIFILVILSAGMIGVLAYIVIATTPPEIF